VKSPGYWLTATKLSVVSGLPFAVLWSYFFALGMHEPFLAVLFPVGTACGAAFGAIFGALVAVRVAPTALVLESSIPFDDFMTLSVNILLRIGYRETGRTTDTIIFKPSLRLGLLAGQIVIVSGQDQVTVRGPAAHVARFERLLGRA
jgi:hypothetical protein